MRVLLIKTSSMGDLIHTLPALTDAGNARLGVRFDWVVEDSFTDIPAWHPLVDQVIPVSLRRWRKELLSSQTYKEGWALRAHLHQQHYDMVLDAQALVKSAMVALCAPGVRVGLDWPSARESLASLAYQRKCQVNFYQHAVVRMRQLFSQAFNYPLPITPPDFGIDREQFKQPAPETPYLVFLHGTTWITKQWPENHWVQLAQLAALAGYRIKVSGGNDDEVERANRIASACEAVDVLPRLQITEMAALLVNAHAAVAVDTGFGHLAAALNVPTVSLYGATDPAFTGALGAKSQLIAAQFPPCAPCLSRTCSYRPTDTTPACLASITPARVWQTVAELTR